MYKKTKTTLNLISSIALFLAVAPASADTISIGLQEVGVNSGAITQMASSDATANFGGSYGSFSTIMVSGAGHSASGGSSILNSTDFNASSTGGINTLYVYVTTQYNDFATGPQSIFSSFTTNYLTAGWSVTENTFFSPTNQLFEGTPLSSASFTGGDYAGKTASANLGSGPWSLTQVYKITTSGAGNANNTIDASISPAPGPVIGTFPGSLPVVVIGLLGFGWWTRRRKQPRSAIADNATP